MMRFWSRKNFNIRLW